MNPKKAKAIRKAKAKKKNCALPMELRVCDPEMCIKDKAMINSICSACDYIVCRICPECGLLWAECRCDYNLMEGLDNSSYLAGFELRI